MFCGFYATGEGQFGAYHPLHWLLYRTLPLGAAFDLECLLNTPLLLAGCYLFFRRWRMRREGALLGALLFAFSGFCMLHFVHVNAVAVVAHVPWLLLAIDVAIRDPGPVRRTLAGAAIAILTASQLLIGYPQYVWFRPPEIDYASISAAVSCSEFVRIPMPYPKGPEFSRIRLHTQGRRRWAMQLVGWKLLSNENWLLYQLLPTLDALKHSNSASGRRGFSK